MPDYIPKPDRAFLAYLTMVLAAIGSQPEAYGTTSLALGPMTAALADFSTSLDAADTAKASAKVAVAAKDADRAELEALFRPFVLRVQTDPSVTDALKTGASLPLRDTTRTFSAPVAPVDLVATADASGTNMLRWSGAGNASGIQFVIEARIGAAADFSTIDVVTATSYRHTGRTPGQTVQYRIRARRGAAVSDPSNAAVVYPA